jgi:hypothetical protein
MITGAIIFLFYASFEELPGIEHRCIWIRSVLQPVILTALNSPCGGLLGIHGRINPTPV